MIYYNIMANRNVFFYSEKCQLSRNIMQMLGNEGLVNYFYLFCVDNQLHNLPPGITRVPTMIVVGIDRPLVTTDIIGWINTMKFIKQQNIDKKNEEKNRLAGFSNTEMGSVSDKFALTNKDMCLPQNYFGIGDEERNTIFTAPEFDKINKFNQKKLINQKERDRKEQDTKFNDYNKQQRMEAINKSMNANKRY